MVSPGVFAVKETIWAPLSAGVVVMLGAAGCGADGDWARAAIQVIMTVTNEMARICLPPAR
jgi:hypothetical protein